MSQLLINHSPDLKQLRDKGYEVEVIGGYLVIHQIPYVNSLKEIKYGKLITTLRLQGNRTVKPDTHVILFQGDQPCNKDGSVIQAIVHSRSNVRVSAEIMANHSFSNKPQGGFANYFDKVENYVRIICHPAKAIDSSVTAQTYNVVVDKENESVFQYVDTNSSRANITAVNEKFKQQKIAIVGLGGTGSYILDLVSKTPVKEIHLFDADELLQHNAFRFPGAVDGKYLDTADRKLKVEYLDGIYSKMHKGITAHSIFIDEANITELKGMDYVFICVDKNSVRKFIMDYLIEADISFLDVGLGVNLVDDKLIGTLRVTSATSEKNDHLEDRIPVSEDDDNEYGTNIQIADLNCLNAVLAVMKWKKMSGFYQDFKEEYHTTYTINTSQLLHGDLEA